MYSIAETIVHLNNKERSHQDCDKMMTLRGVGHAVNSTIGAASETKQYMKEKRELKAAHFDMNEQPETVQIHGKTHQYSRTSAARIIDPGLKALSTPRLMTGNWTTARRRMKSQILH